MEICWQPLWTWISLLETKSRISRIVLWKRTYTSDRHWPASDGKLVNSFTSKIISSPFYLQFQELKSSLLKKQNHVFEIYLHLLSFATPIVPLCQKVCQKKAQYCNSCSGISVLVYNNTHLILLFSYRRSLFILQYCSRSPQRKLITINKVITTYTYMIQNRQF